MAVWLSFQNVGGCIVELVRFVLWDWVVIYLAAGSNTQVCLKYSAKVVAEWTTRRVQPEPP